MRTRLIALALTIVTLLVLGIGAAVAAPRAGNGWGGHDQMHGSQQMRAMHADMPAELQAECDAMHARMSSQTGSMRGWMHGQAGMGGMHGQRGGARR